MDLQPSTQVAAAAAGPVALVLAGQAAVPLAVLHRPLQLRRLQTRAAAVGVAHQRLAVNMARLVVLALSYFRCQQLIILV